MIDENDLFNLYCTDHPKLVGSNKSIKSGWRTISKPKFLHFAKRAQSNIKLSDYRSREEAKEVMISNMGFFEFLFFKAIIMWIIEKILDHYFGYAEFNHLPKNSARVL